MNPTQYSIFVKGTILSGWGDPTDKYLIFQQQNRVLEVKSFSNSPIKISKKKLVILQSIYKAIYLVTEWNWRLFSKIIWLINVIIILYFLESHLITPKGVISTLAKECQN